MPFSNLWRTRYVFAVLLFGLSALISEAFAQTPGWQAGEAINAQILVPGGQWQPLASGAPIAAGSELKTGPGGRVVLSRNGDTVTLSPHSAMKLPNPGNSADQPSVMQKLGTMLYKIRKRSRELLRNVSTGDEADKPFKVDTPYLAAVIKGTVFSVSVTSQGSALHVTEGLVEAISQATGERGLVRPGQTARVSSLPGAGLSINTGARKGKKNTGGEAKEAKGGKSAEPGAERKAEAKGQNKGGGKQQAKAAGKSQTGSRAKPKSRGLRVAVGGGGINIGQATKGLLRGAGGANLAGNVRGHGAAKGGVPGKGNAGGPGKIKTPGQLTAGLGGPGAGILPPGQGGTPPGLGGGLPPGQGGTPPGLAGGLPPGQGGAPPGGPPPGAGPPGGSPPGGGNGGGNGGNGNNGCNGNGNKPGC